VDDDLTVNRTLGLQQHRIHVNRRFQAARLSLDSLGTSDLAAIAANRGVFDMFCDLNGATRKPARLNARHSAVLMMLLPTSDAVPMTIKVLALISNSQP